jgi:hypothetical protein
MLNFTLWWLYHQESTPVATEWAAEWAPEPVWTFWRRENSPFFPHYIFPDQLANGLITVLYHSCKLMFDFIYPSLQDNCGQ